MPKVTVETKTDGPLYKGVPSLREKVNAYLMSEAVKKIVEVEETENYSTLSVKFSNEVVPNNCGCTPQELVTLTVEYELND